MQKFIVKTVIVLLSCFVVGQGFLFAQIYSGDFDIESQSDMDAFFNAGYTAIEGDLTIYGNDIETLDGLANLQQVSGNVSINNCMSLLSADLPNLESIDGQLEITSNPNLENITLEKLNSLATNIIYGGLNISYNVSLIDIGNFPSLNTINGNIEIKSNSNLLSIKGLEALTNVISDLSIASNYSLLNLEGLESLERISGALRITKNNNLNNLVGLQSLKKIVGDFEIYGNESLGSLEGLHSLEEIVGSVGLQYLDNPTLASSNMLPKLKIIRGALNLTKFDNSNLFSALEYLHEIIIDFSSISVLNFDFPVLNELENLVISVNNNLRHINGLNTVKTINWISISYNNNLESIDGFQNTEVINNLKISSNNKLESINAFQNTQVINTLEISSNNKLESINAFQNTEVINNLEISSNLKLVNIDGFQKLKNTIVLKIFWNPSLSSLNIFNSLKTITTSLQISLCNGLEVIDAFPQLETVNSLEISRNDQLKTIKPFPKLKTIDELIIANNPELIELCQLPNLNSIRTFLRIYKNPLLSDCCPILCWLNLTQGSAYINSNGSFCSLNEIEKNCESSTCKSDSVEKFACKGYPNPCLNTLNISFTYFHYDYILKDDLEYQIYTNNGILITEQLIDLNENNNVFNNGFIDPNITETDLEIDVSDLIPGLYLIRLFHPVTKRISTFSFTKL